MVTPPILMRALSPPPMRRAKPPASTRPRGLVMRAAYSAPPRPACGERSTRVARRGGGRRAGRGRGGGGGRRFREPEPVETPPHPDLLPARGEKELAERADKLPF